MNDYERTKALLDSLGILYDEETVRSYSRFWDCNKTLLYEKVKSIIVSEHLYGSNRNNSRVEGYRDFHTEFNFDSDGNFICMGIFE
jgi:hypothetical protein